MAELDRRPDQAEADAIQSALADNQLNDRRGTFVTLKMDNQLRGCIGTLSATDTIVNSIKDNAVNAAFRDFRFSPLTARELDRVEIEVSILTEPQVLEYQDSDDLVARLKPHVDGVIIRKGATSATFLPQVWEQLPRPEDFLNHLCLKAGLSSSAWEESVIKVSTYQVQYFEEAK